MTTEGASDEEAGVAVGNNAGVVGRGRPVFPTEENVCADGVDTALQVEVVRLLAGGADRAGRTDGDNLIGAGNEFEQQRSKLAANGGVTRIDRPLIDAIAVHEFRSDVDIA